MIKVVFCLTGNNFSNKFIQSWTKLLTNLHKFRVQPWFSYTTGSEIFAVRNAALSADKSLGANQKPFRGLVDYDYIMWIDSDQVYEPNHFQKLLDTLQKNPNIHITSGLYLDATQSHFSAVKYSKQDEIKYTTKPEGFLTPKSIAHRRKPLKVAFNGMGFMLVRQGVFESFPYPWFYQMRQDQPGLLDNSGEDASFCIRARELGFDTYVDPTVVVGHEKLIVV